MPRITTIVRRVGRALAILEQALLCAMVGTLVVLAFAQIVLRIGFSSGWMWADPFLRHLVLWTALLGAALVTKDGKHINIDVLSRFLPARGACSVQAVTDLFSAFICGLLAYTGYRFVCNERESSAEMAEFGVEMEAFLGVPCWVAELIFPIAFGLIALRFLIRFVQDLVVAFKGRAES